ncbi:MAG TPA: Ldh family oxidoreductase [Candidatus Dojkabacteria bacterium]
MKIKLEKLQNLINDCLKTIYEEHEASLVTDVVMSAEMAGRKTHGIARLIAAEHAVLEECPIEKPEIKRKSNISATIDAKGNNGMVVSALAMNEALKMAKENGIGIVGTHGSESTSGALSIYLEKIADQDMIGIMLSKSAIRVAPHGSRERLFGTNPIGVCFPTSERPFILDMTTAAASYGEIYQAKIKGEMIRDNVAIDKEGNITRDPKKALEGSILSFDRSYKGSNLALLVEFFAGLLPGAGFMDLHTEDKWGNFFLVMKPDLLMDLDEYKAKADEFITRLKKTRTISGREMRISGESSLKKKEEILNAGEIDVDEKVVNNLKEFLKNN